MGLQGFAIASEWAADVPSPKEGSARSVVVTVYILPGVFSPDES